MAKIMVATNALQNVEAEVLSSHRAELAALHKYTKHQVIDWVASRMSIDRMRNLAAEIAMEQECDYLVFVDDDMILEPRTIEKLVESDYDVIMAHTFIRGGAFEPMAFKNIGTVEDLQLKAFYELEDLPQGIHDCYAVGFAVCALKVEWMKKLEKPYFVTAMHHTEDIYYCIRLKREFGEDIKIGVHTGVPTQHRVGSLYVGQSNIKKVREFFGVSRDSAPTDKGRGDHEGNSYHKEMTEAGLVSEVDVA